MHNCMGSFTCIPHIPLIIYFDLLIVPKLLDISSSISKTHHVRKRKRRPKTTLEDQLQDYKFTDVYELTSDILGTGAGSTVLTCTKKSTGKKYAVKVGWFCVVLI